MLMTARDSRSRASTRGFVLLEVLISILILAFGLLGLAKLQASTRQLEMESYQRAQAVVLLQDMVSRLSANMKAAGCYAISDINTGAPFLGTGATAPTTCAAGSGTTAQQQTAAQDLADWNNMLLGSSELGSSGKEGAMIGARGCVSYDSLNNVYVVAVVWQGLMATAPPKGLSCATGQYQPTDNSRRAVSAVVRVATLYP